MKRTISALLALMMLVTAVVACGKKVPDPVEGTTDTQTTVTTESVSDTVVTEPAETEPVVTARAEAKDSLPEDLNLEGREVKIFWFSAGDYDINGIGEVSGDIIMDAVYNRTQSVKERLNVKITDQKASAAKWRDFSQELANVVASGDDAWQIVFAGGNATVQSGRNHLFLDLSDANYLDLDQPWWWSQPMEELSLDGKERRYLIGDIALSNYLRFSAVFYNKNIYSEKLGDPDDMYKLVLDDNWTLDKMMELSEKAYSDLNGDGKVNSGDTYGLLVGARSYIQICDYCVDIPRYYRDDNGYPVIQWDEERASLAVEKLCKLIWETNGNAYSETDVAYKAFAARETFFFVNQFLAALQADLKDMKDDYGIIPFPKLDENQENYMSLIFNSSNVVCVPTTCKNADDACAVIEAMCAESYRSVIEPFYDTALKIKYSRDAYSGQCMDIIRDSAAKNFLYEYAEQIGSGAIITDCVIANDSGVVISKIKNGAVGTKIALEKMIKKLNG